MNSVDFRSARERLDLTPEAFAAELGLTPHVVAAFENGTVTVPKGISAEIRWRVAVTERQDALAASGLPACAWVARWEHAHVPAKPSAQLKHFEALNAHATSCPTCVAREAFVAERFGPMPERPVQGWAGFVGAVVARVERLPAWLRPAAYGALMFTVMSAFRVLVMLPRLHDTPDGWLVALGGLGVSAAFGAVLGSVVAGVRRAWNAMRSRRSTVR